MARSSARRTAALALLLLASGAGALTAHVPHDAVSDVAVSPRFSSDGTVFAIVRDSLFRSLDGGATWRRLAFGLEDARLRALAVSPRYAADRTVVAAADEGRLYLSRDGGRTWQERGPGLSREDMVQVELSTTRRGRPMLLAADGSGRLFRSGDLGASWTEPFTSGRVTALGWADRAIVGTAEGEIFVSPDGGRVWHLYAHLPSAGAVTSLDVPPGAGVYQGLNAGTESGWVASVTGGGQDGPAVSVERASRGPIQDLATVPGAGGAALLAAAWDEVAIAGVAGGGWRPTAGGLLKNPQADAYRQAHFTSLAVADDGTVFVGGFSGLFESADRGLGWAKLGTLTVRHVVGLDVAPAASGPPTLAVATYGGGAYVLGPRSDGWQIGNSGLVNPRLGAIAFSPAFATDRTLFAATYGAVLRSTDGGLSWRASPVRDPLDRATGLAEPLALAPSPAFASDRTLFAGCFPNGLLRSTDGGRTFSLLWDSLGRPLRQLALSPAFARDRTLFAALAEGVYRSRDGGESWQPLAPGLDFEQPALAISPGFAHDRTLFVGAADGLYRSSDGGDSWRRLPLPGTGPTPVAALAISPDFVRDGVLVVQVRGGDLYWCRAGRGFKARRTAAAAAGLEFSHVIRREATPRIRFSPEFATDRTLWAAAGEELVWSADRGRSWRRLARPVRYEAEASQPLWIWVPVVTDGDWYPLEGDRFSGTGAIASPVAGSSATLRFVGTGVRWLGSRGPDLGFARVYLDGEPVARVELSSPTVKSRDVLFSSTVLDRGRHELRIEVIGLGRNGRSGAVVIDAFDVDE